MYAKKLPIDREALLKMTFEAGKMAKEAFLPFGMERVVKEGGSPVTATDEAINRYLVRSIREIAPEIDIVGEEGSDRRESEWRAFVDPIDGTLPFTWGVKQFAVMIGLARRGVPVMGAVYNPFMDEIFFAQKGLGAWYGTTPIHVSKEPRMTGRPVVGFSSFKDRGHDMAGALSILADKDMYCTNWCASGTMAMLLAVGEFDAVVCNSPHLHDSAAPHIIMEEAGAIVTDLNGGHIDYSGDSICGHIAASTPQMHATVLDSIIEASAKKKARK